MWTTMEDTFYSKEMVVHKVYFTKQKWDYCLFPTQNSSWNVFVVGCSVQQHSNSMAKKLKMSPALTEACWIPLMDLSQPQGYWMSVPQDSCWQDASAGQKERESSHSTANLPAGKWGIWWEIRHGVKLTSSSWILHGVTTSSFCCSSLLWMFQFDSLQALCLFRHSVSVQCKLLISFI